ncbi:Uncharacterized protein BP5553_09496 [Venustampulla echinocandica]|uniref:Uncharacterized protein n=1 Tax=Venustampulla echinocandica TaxID=2656787 RepID=A0A370TCZ6_9HELO|nr:Uncharacterized protein BP5553_09496 [Venustampulla echinocandica]RDL32094.1 Uncharacterized protein BP5553_09496 [Venustampulla echinocandica]
MSSTTPSSPPHSAVSPLKRKAMSVTQTYYLAHTARGKLSAAAARPDHDLRLLVGHANLLDSLMLELAEAEQEQESWFNQSVKKATKTEEPRHVQWADTAFEDPEEDWQAEDADLDSSDSDSDYDFEEEMESLVSLHRVQSNPTAAIAVEEVEEDEDEEFEDDGEEDYASLQLHLTTSHPASPPELDHDSDSSEDESMPPSPPSDMLPTFSEKQRSRIATTSYYSKSPEAPSIPANAQGAFVEEGFYLPRTRGRGLVSAISVY